MSVLGGTIEITVAGMGIVLLTLAVLALLTRGLGLIAGGSGERMKAEDAIPVRETAADSDGGRRRAAAIAAVLAMIERSPETRTQSRPDGWDLVSRVEAAGTRARWAERKEHWS